MSKPNPGRVKLSPVEAQFVDLVAQGVDMVQAWCQAYRNEDKGKARQAIPSLLARASVKAALEGITISGEGTKVANLDDLASADKEMLALCLEIRRNPLASVKDKLDAVKTYSAIRAKIGPATTSSDADPSGPVDLGELLGSFRQERFTDTDRRGRSGGFQVQAHSDGQSLVKRWVGADSANTPGHPRDEAHPPHCPSSPESAQNFSQEESELCP